MIRDRNKVLETNLIVKRCCFQLCLCINSMHMHICRCTNMHMYSEPCNEKAGFCISENKGAEQLLGKHSSSQIRNIKSLAIFNGCTVRFVLVFVKT